MNKNIREKEGYDNLSKQKSFTLLVSLGLSTLLSSFAIANGAGAMDNISNTLNDKPQTTLLNRASMEVTQKNEITSSYGVGTNIAIPNNGSLNLTSDISSKGAQSSYSAGQITLGSPQAKIRIDAGWENTSKITITAKTLNAYISELNTHGKADTTNNVISIIADDATMVIDKIIGGANNATGTSGTMLLLDRANLTIGSMSSGENTNNGVIFGGSAVVNGDISKIGNGANSFVFTGYDSSLTLKGANSVIGNLVSLATVQNGHMLTLDASLNDNVQATIASLRGGERLNVVFNGVDSQRSTRLNLDTTQQSNQQGSQQSISRNSQLRSVSVASGINNTLALSGNGTMSIHEGVQVAEGRGLTFSLGDGTTLDLKAGMRGEGESSISVDSGSATLAGGTINVKNIKLSGTTSGLTLKAQNTNISTLLANASTSSTLTLDGSADAVIAEIQEIKGDHLKISMIGHADSTSTNTLATDSVATKAADLYLHGGVIESIEVKSGFFNSIYFVNGTTTITKPINHATTPNNNSRLLLALEGGNLVLADAINTEIDNSTPQTKVDIRIDSGTLSLSGQNNIINSLSVDRGAIDLAMNNGNPTARVGQNFKTLNIKNLSIADTLTFKLYVDPKATSGKSDKIVLTKVQASDSGVTGNVIFTVAGNAKDILAVTYEKGGNNNVVLGENMGNINVLGGESLIGYDVIKAQVVKTDDGKVYLGTSINQGVKKEFKDVTKSALAVNYDLYLANFNSLNKRMGELRDNPHIQGVWARIFGGAMSNDIGAGSKSEYVTAQGGYDYALNVGENAKNYTGVALAYSRSWTKSNPLNIQINNGISNAITIGLKDVNSSAVEVGVYNSYVADVGWYNDTILKLDYIMGAFSMTDNPSLQSKVGNFAMVLGDEVGYRYKFGSNVSYYLDPQLEIALGYFNQSDFNRAMQNTSSTLQASQDSIFILRARTGAKLGKKLSMVKSFANVYVGAFYEYDYINGGNAQILSNTGMIITPLEGMQSNGRTIANIGSNIGLTENARLYIDVEKSFGDKQKTFMQFNFGGRYSF